MSVCLVLCVCRGSKYSEVVPDWLILNSDLYGTIHDCGPLRTQFDDVVVLAVVFFALFCCSIGFLHPDNSQKSIIKTKGPHTKGRQEQ